jgi:hypothetical protein
VSTAYQFDADLKEAMKARDHLRLSVIRMIKASVKNREIEKMSNLSDEEIVSVLTSLAKQRRESIEHFLAAGRTDLAEKEKSELDVITRYLPEQLSPEDLDKLIQAAMKECDASSPNDVGKVMKLLMPRVRGIADGQTVNRRVRELLASGA